MPPSVAPPSARPIGGCAPRLHPARSENPRNRDTGPEQRIGVSGWVDSRKARVVRYFGGLNVEENAEAGDHSVSGQARLGKGQSVLYGVLSEPQRRRGWKRTALRFKVVENTTSRSEQ